MKKAFTLVELLVIIAIIATMVTISVVSVRAGQSAARLKGATRDIFATIRHARSVALTSQKPSIITYSNTDVDGEKCAKIEIVTAKLFSDSEVTEAETIQGEKVSLVEVDPEVETPRVSVKSKSANGEASATEEFKGHSVGDVLFAPIDDNVLRGICIKVTKANEQLEVVDVEKTKPKISVFSNVDYLIGKLKESKEKETAKKADETKESNNDSSSASASAVDMEPVSVVWQVNGRTEPHRVWVYCEGASPESGLSINIDRFGGAKVLGTGEEADN